MGKERVAHTIHCNNGDRKDNLFIALHCASLSEGILEGKLSGHEKGTFSDRQVRDEAGLNWRMVVIFVLMK
jgi:transcriptional regulator with GAF, ATPase, and Fis domain